MPGPGPYGNVKVTPYGNGSAAEHCIQEVWETNLEVEFLKIYKVAAKYKYVAMDTEFPGVVARPIGEFKSTADYQYQLLRCNVDLLKIIQLGITFYDAQGNTPPGITTWQFNFKFNLQEDMYAQDSIDLLQNSGIQFDKHEANGIDAHHFAELMICSGLVLLNNVRWISFHSGYDFGYMLKILTNKNLPQDEVEFFNLLKIYFPCIYDVKYLMKSCKNLKGGLQEVAEQLELERIGPQHQAGSDSLLTGASFFKMREMFFEDNIDDDKYCGHLYGLGASYMNNGSNVVNPIGGDAKVVIAPGDIKAVVKTTSDETALEVETSDTPTVGSSTLGEKKPSASGDTSKEAGGGSSAKEEEEEKGGGDGGGGGRDVSADASSKSTDSDGSSTANG